MSQKLERSVPNINEYLRQLEKNLKYTIFIDITVVNSLSVIDFDRFTQYLIKAIADDKGKTIQSTIDAVISCDFTVDQLGDKVQGCREKCPFCTAPCCLTDKDHAGDHQASQHYLFGIIGIQENSSSKLCTYNCQSVIDSDLRWCFDYNNAESTLDSIRNYKKYHSRWEIKPDRSMQTSLYWKWFMANFNAQLAQWHAAKPADFPNEWSHITMHQAKDSLDNV